MKATFQPFPDDEPHLKRVPFIQRLVSDPEYAEKMRAHYDSMLVQPHTPETAEMHLAARTAMHLLRHHTSLVKAKHVLNTAKQLIATGSLKYDPVERLRQLMQEVGHLLPHIHEPEHTQITDRYSKYRALLSALPDSMPPIPPPHETPLHPPPA